MKNILALLILILFVHIDVEGQKNNLKPRTIVTTDGEIDDVDSYIRMLLYANEFRLEGLVYSSSQWHYKGDGKGTKFTSELDITKRWYGERTSLRWPGVTWQQELISEYEKIYPNLSLHAKGYPTPSYLRSLIKVGNIDFEGEMEKITEGSEFIKTKLLDNNLEPLYLQVWGGTNTIARALKSIEEQYKNTPQWKKIYDKVCKKAILYAILDQDNTYKKYIAPNWPDLKIYYNSNQFWCFAYPWPESVPEPLQPYLRGPFMSKNIILDHGPLLAKYYSYGDGQHQEGDDDHIHGTDLVKHNEKNKSTFEKYDFISEGDSPAYLHLTDVGLDNLNNPHFGGWGGRLVQSKEQPNRWEDGDQAADFNPYTNKIDKTYPQTRWVGTLQNDFAARADWCIKPYKDANHAPNIKLLSKKNIIAIPGQTINMMTNAIDPDGHKLSYTWWQYEDVDTYEGKVDIQNANSKNASIKTPSDLKKGQTIHIILEVKDNHELPMTRYKRIVITGK
jgi:hypothetical protein